MNEERKKQKQVFSGLKTMYYKQRESDLQLLEEFKALKEEFKQDMLNDQRYIRIMTKKEIEIKIKEMLNNYLKENKVKDISIFLTKKSTKTIKEITDVNLYTEKS